MASRLTYSSTHTESSHTTQTHLLKITKPCPNLTYPYVPAHLDQNPSKYDMDWCKYRHTPDVRASYWQYSRKIFQPFDIMSNATTHDLKNPAEKVNEKKKAKKKKAHVYLKIHLLIANWKQYHRLQSMTCKCSARAEPSVS